MAPKQAASKHFRSAIGPMALIIWNMKKKMKKEHVEGMNKTPFKLLFKALYDGQLSIKLKDNTTVCKILNTYADEGKCFHIGTKCLSPTAKDISVLFGIPFVNKLKKRKEKKEDTKGTVDDAKKFKKRYFDEVTVVKSNHIQDALDIVVLKSGDEAVTDFCVLMCSLICCCLFFPNPSGSIPKNILDLLYEEMDITNWPEKICEELMKSASKYNTLKSAPGGCTMALVYWLVEHVNIASMKKGKENEIPRVVRWDLDEIYAAITNTDLSTVTVSKIESDLKLTEIEKKLIRGINAGDDVEFYEIAADVVDDDATAEDVVLESDDDEESLKEKYGGLKEKLKVAAKIDVYASKKADDLKDEVKELERRLKDAKQKIIEKDQQIAKLTRKLQMENKRTTKNQSKCEEATTTTRKRAVEASEPMVREKRRKKNNDRVGAQKKMKTTTAEVDNKQEKENEEKEKENKGEEEEKRERRGRGGGRARGGRERRGSGGRGGGRGEEEKKEEDEDGQQEEEE